MDFEEAIVAGIVAQFFTTHPASTDPNGQTYYMPAPALNVAQQMFNANKEAILQAVTEKLDVDDIAAKVAASVAKDLTESPSNFGYWRRSGAEQFQKDLRLAVIEKLAATEVERIRHQLDNDPA